MKGVSFHGFHSFRDLNLILTSKEIGAPEVKRQTIDLAGADGELDFTDFFGEPKYEDVTHKFKFHTIVPYSEFMTLYSTIKNAIHGKKMRIILDDDPLFYWMGRCYVSGFTNEKSIGQVEVECDCEPFKYKLEKTVVTKAVNGTESITLTNGRKRAVPLITIETAGSLRIIYGDNFIWDLGSGSYTLPELELTEGANIVTVTGTGTITFTYQEAGL